MFQCCQRGPTNTVFNRPQIYFCLREQPRASRAAPRGRLPLVTSTISSAFQPRAKGHVLPHQIHSPRGGLISFSLFTLPALHGRHCRGCCSESRRFHYNRGMREFTLEGELATTANPTPSFITSFKDSSSYHPAQRLFCPQAGLVVAALCSHVPLHLWCSAGDKHTEVCLHASPVRTG